MADWREVREIQKRYLSFYHISGASTVILLLLLIGAILFAHGLLDSYSTNVYTEAVSAIASVVVTVLILDKRAEQREARRRIKELQEKLVREAGSPANPVAKHAIKELENHEWLEGENGLLQGKDLSNADLRGVILAKANLIGTAMWYAILSDANLYMANLKGATLWRAKLNEAKLHWADLGNVILAGADLRGANLQWVNLEGAILFGLDRKGDFQLFDEHWNEWDLEDVIVEGDKLYKAQFDENTILPDGSKYSNNTNMRRFTDRTYQGFWEPPLDDTGNPVWWYMPSMSEPGDR